MRSMRLIGVLLGLLLCGCASAGAAWVELRGQRIAVEVADDPQERGRGLMFRDRMEPGTGMLFVHEEEQMLSYWMKNTRIALDILYFDDSRRLVSVQRDVPPCRLATQCPTYPSDGPARFVLELNAGEATSLGVQTGDMLTISPTVAH